MEIIVAVDENYGIGKDGDLLAHLSPDLNSFCLIAKRRI